jgi:hypothetical protein
MPNSWWLRLGSFMPLFCVMVVGVWFYVARFKLARRLARRAYEQPPMNYDFTLGELEQLYREGKMTAEECDRAKAIVLRKNQATTERANTKSTGGFPVIAPHNPHGPPRK